MLLSLSPPSIADRKFLCMHHGMFHSFGSPHNTQEAEAKLLKRLLAKIKEEAKEKPPCDKAAKKDLEGVGKVHRDDRCLSLSKNLDRSFQQH